MRFSSQKVASVASQSQEILQQAVCAETRRKGWRVSHAHLAAGGDEVAQEPDKATLRELIPPDMYARWLVQRNSTSVATRAWKKCGPFGGRETLDAAIKELQLGYGGSWGRSGSSGKEEDSRYDPTLGFTFKTDDLRGQIKAFSREKLADEEYFTRTVELTEALSNKQVEDARARAWATGDIAKLQELPPLPDADSSCDQAIVNALAMTTASRPICASRWTNCGLLWQARH